MKQECKQIRIQPEAWSNYDDKYFGFTKFASNYKVIYDSSVKDAFNIYTKKGIIKFMQIKGGLYVYQHFAKYLNFVADEKGMMPPGDNNALNTICVMRKWNFASHVTATMVPTFIHACGKAKTQPQDSNLKTWPSHSVALIISEFVISTFLCCYPWLRKQLLLHTSCDKSVQLTSCMISTVDEKSWDTQSINLKLLNMNGIFIILLDFLLLRIVNIFCDKT